jgi:CheY-like chemotaxis protein
MSRRVLLVDDEPSLLNGIQRRLGSEFDLTSAASGEDGLKAIREAPPFEVVVTDMRMPKMNGIQFIQAARLKSPDSVYIMLTGNQDQATAIHALNDGHVFRFLTKPCQSPDLKRAIEAGLHQYRLVTGEKELLQKTFVGAVNVLTDFLELAQPGLFGRADAVQEIVGQIQTDLHLESQWEYKLSARLGMLGFALLPEQERLRFEMAAESGGELRASIRTAAAVGRRIIERIPRLGTVAKIIGMCGEVDGSTLMAQPKNEIEKAITGATMLRVALEWDNLSRQGLSSQAAVYELSQSLPNLSPRLVEVFSALKAKEIDDDGIEVEVTELVEGMVLHEDVLTGDGVMLIRAGRRLTWTIIEKLRSYQSSVVRLRPVRVRISTTDAEKPALVAIGAN